MISRRIFGAMAATVLACGLALTCGCEKKTTSSSSSGTSSSGGGSGTPAARDTHVFTMPGGQTPKLAFVPNNPSDFWKIAAAGLKKYESETGIHVDMITPTNGKVEEQNQILSNLVSQGYNGIALSSIAPDDQISEINRACRKTNVICFDSDCPKSDRLVYIGTNNYEAGKVLGNEIVKLLPNGGTMAVFVGTFAADNAQQRLKGIQDVVEPKGIKIVAKKEDNGDREKARSNVEGIIKAYPDINLLTGLWSYNGPAIVKAVDAAGKKGQIKVATFDEEDGTLDGIENGTVTCTVVQKPFEFGYRSAKLLYELATKGKSALPKTPFIDTGVTVINADNVKDFRQKLNEMKSGK